MRATWNDTFLAVAETMANRATCKRAKHGAVIVRDNRILTTGYNGAPPGEPHCTEVGCLMKSGHCVRTLHAEENAIIQAANIGVSLAGATIYVTGPPCIHDSKRILAAGISRVLYLKGYRDDDPFTLTGIEWMKKAIDVVQIGERLTWQS